MKQVVWIMASVFICIQLAGCAGWTLRSSISERPRVDQEVAGNRGFISGKAPAEPKEPSFTKRKVYQLEIEVPSFSKGKSASASRATTQAKVRTDTEDWGNKGYIFGAPQQETGPAKFDAQPVEELANEQPMTAGPGAATMCTYTVRKGDTLQKISQKFYGTTKKWLSLFEANKDKLKSPDKVYSGQILTIPEIAGYRK